MSDEVCTYILMTFEAEAYIRVTQCGFLTCFVSIFHLGGLLLLCISFTCWLNSC